LILLAAPEMSNAALKLFKKYDLQVVFACGLLIAITLIAFDQSREFGVNLFTEISGVALTVFIINKILERKERQKRIAIDQRILRDVQAIIASYFSIWKHLTWLYMPDEKVRDGNDVLRIYPNLVKSADLNDQFIIVSTHHPESWKLFFHNRSIKDCFKNYYETLENDIRLFIIDFKMFLEPELLDYLLNIMEGTYFKNIYMMCYEEEMEKILIELEQNKDHLESYVSSDELSHLHQFLELINYSKRLQSTISKFSETNVELYQIKKYFIHPAQFA
jgi:hypothetical protein